MWLSFRLTRSIRLGVAWWLIPLALLAMLAVFIAECALYTIIGVLKLIALAGAALIPPDKRKQAKPAGDPVRVTIHVKDAPAEQSTQRPGEIG